MLVNNLNRADSFALKTNNLSFKQQDFSKLIQEDRIVDTFIKAAKIDTGSKEELSEKNSPSTPGQSKLAEVLEKELKKVGLEEIKITNEGVLYATLPSNMTVKNQPVMGLIAHLDTSKQVPTGPVKPIIHENYKGGNIQLKGKTVIEEDDLKDHVGKDIITSDGTTLLGADDKAGIAEIIEAMRVLKENPNIKHPKIRIAFNPDEEIGIGNTKINIKEFGVDFAYTVDGSSPCEVEGENFNAFNPEIIIKGKNVHPGYAYKKMINSLKIANEFLAALPQDQAPETTKDFEGYYHPMEMKGNESETKIQLLVRDFDLDGGKNRIKYLKKVASMLRQKHPGCKIQVKPNESYKNMKEKVKGFPEVLKFAEEGLRRSGLTPVSVPIRGGTDGSVLSLRNLITPNLGTGGVNFHSETEFVPIQDMKKATENILNTISIWAENAKKIAPTIKERRETVEFNDSMFDKRA